jgi:adenosylcobinamide kinase/adenosylcobinamide-phosphate guanylyltransferase
LKGGKAWRRFGVKPAGTGGQEQKQRMEDVLAPAIRCRSVLALGGARSGKSGYALRLAEAAAPERLYLATAAAGDAEMAVRIARHRAERGAGWSTREEPLDLLLALAAEARPGRVIVVDCVTIWLANCLFAGRDADSEIAALAAATPTFAGPVIFVSNEVGSGIVPETPLGRAFRDLQGRANQALAAACDVVALVTAGLPTLIKPAPRPALSLG